MTDTRQPAANLSDRRALRSRRQLWQALLALLHDHDWAEINVAMICARADLARSTFYAHFPTKQDLLEAGFSFGLDQIEQLAAQMASTPGDLPTLHWLVDHLAGSQGFQRRLQGTPGGLAIMTRFRAMATDLIRRDLIRAGQPPSDAGLVFAIGGVFATLDHWIATQCLEPQPALVRRLRQQIHAAAKG